MFSRPWVSTPNGEKCPPVIDSWGHGRLLIDGPAVLIIRIIARILAVAELHIVDMHFVQ